MGKVKVLKASPLSTIQDFGRFGYRRYGIPQCGAMDKYLMIQANRLVGNPDQYPVVEFALGGLHLIALEHSIISIAGATSELSERKSLVRLEKGQTLKILPPHQNYAYVAMAGLLDATKDFESYSTDLKACFGGISGRYLKTDDELSSSEIDSQPIQQEVPHLQTKALVPTIRIMKGPEWHMLKQLPTDKLFFVEPSSDRMGIRLGGEKIEIDYKEISSSAVIPGTIQLPPGGRPIVLMNDCQTTGGYPRIAKVLDADLSTLAQIRPGKAIRFVLED